MGFSDVAHNEAEFHTVRTIGRIAQLILDLRTEYERRPSDATISQIRHRIGELVELERQLRPSDVQAAS
ncbi:MAG: hypothetical protein M3281_02560 [Chloroflexota bacterium]|nr:hypothetical protein [Chloroflexota bacterium]